MSSSQKITTGAVLICSSLAQGNSLAIPKIKPNGSGTLHGALMDVACMHNFLSEQGIEVSKIFADVNDTTKDHVVYAIRKCFLEYDQIVLYYTGHGKKLTGDWCFSDGNESKYITISELLHFYKVWAPGKPLLIVSDCCYSGAWIQNPHVHDDEYEDVMIQASCGAKQLSHDGAQGSLFTSYWIKIANHSNPDKKPKWSTSFHLIADCYKFCASVCSKGCVPVYCSVCKELNFGNGIRLINNYNDMLFCEKKENVANFLSNFSHLCA